MKVIEEIITQCEVPVEGCKMYYEPIDKLPNNRFNNQYREKLETLDLEDLSHNKDKANVILSLLYLKCGGVDEAHDIVTPYSWGSLESFAAQPPVYDSPARHEACYVHAMVHRREGQFVGEYGTGWNNSTYWFGTVGRHPLYETVYKDALEKAATNSILQQHLSSHGKMWKPSAFLKTCEEAVKTKDKTLMDFCSFVINHEWKLLYDYCVALEF